jgi:translocation and assembly module TamA
MQTTLARPFFLAVVLLLSGCSETNELGEILPFYSGLGGGVAYEVEFEGELDDDLQKLMQRSSQLVALRREPSPSRAALRRRISSDTDNFRSVLRSEGYYSGSVETEIDDTDERIHIAIKIDPGPRYSLASYTIDYLGDHAGTDTLPRDSARFEANPGMPARGEDIVAIEERLLQHLENTGRPLGKVAERLAVVDHDTRTMTVELHVDPGPPVVFGPLGIDRLDKVEEDYIRDLVDWPEGEVFDQRVLEDTRRTLSKTNLFQSVRVEAAEQISEDKQLSVTARVEESKHRTIGAGLTYTTSEGIGGDVSWEHRNLSGRQEKLVLSAHLSEIRQQATATFLKPNFLARDQSLIVNTTARAQQTDAFDERAITVFGGLARDLGEAWWVSGGVTVDYSLVDDDSGNTKFYLVGLPLNAKRNTTENILDPRDGTRLHLQAIPYYDTLGNTDPFTVLELSGFAYYGLGEKKRLVPAARVRIGTIQGPETSELPANKRFYAGGGGSVRGYAFQLAGPLDAGGSPLGGSSVLEGSLELRWRVTDNFGFVPFVDGGTVYQQSHPDFSEEFFWSAGLGLRYFTIAGPIRLDVAFPINPRPGIDDAFQFYVSLGQAF